MNMHPRRWLTALLLGVAVTTVIGGPNLAQAKPIDTKVPANSGPPPIQRTTDQSPHAGTLPPPPDNRPENQRPGTHKVDLSVSDSMAQASLKEFQGGLFDDSSCHEWGPFPGALDG